ncbi:MAG: histidine kinase [Saprospiraceae bacterium]|nr:histidine kinase [Saprospiraceae bacterium]
MAYLPALLLATYFLALWAVPRYLKAKRWPLFLLSTAAAGVFLFYARIKWEELVIYLVNGERFDMPAAKLLKNIIRDYSVVALGVCVYIIGDYRRNQQLNEQLIRAKAEAEIKLLKGQLHPHFLFNSLNNIYSLALSKSDLTADSILRLTELLDYLVYRANQDKVPLSKEVQLLENYVDLEKLRYGEKLRVETNIAPLKDGQMVAPLLLLPFAENCFKHGGPGADGVFRIKITLRSDANGFEFRIANSKRQKKIETPPGGIGLENIRQRLTLLYPNRHRLEITDGAEKYEVYMVVTIIPHPSPLIPNS